MNKFDSLSDFFEDFVHVETENKNPHAEFYFDLHLHTKDSDGSIKVEKLAKFLRDKTYLVAVTDHNEICGGSKLRELGIKVVPAIELGCDDGVELLVYFKNISDAEIFYDTHVRPYRNPNRMAKTTKDVFYYLEILQDYEVHISIPHIKGMAQKNFLENKTYIHTLLEFADSIEVHNHGLGKKGNAAAMRVQKIYKKFETLGSDAHTMREIISYFHYINRNRRAWRNFFDNFHKVRVISGIGIKHLKYYMKNRQSESGIES
ncbi:MAG: PHP domain-containing protein [Fusobacteriaceae bacterium]